MESLDDLIYDGNIPHNTWNNANMACRRAKYCMRLHRYDEAIKQLEISAEAVIAFDNRPDEVKSTSLVLGETVRKKTDFETADSRALREILRDSWLAEPEFDPIRDSADFQAILEQLK